MHAICRLRAYAPEFLYGQLGNELEGFLGSDAEQPVGLAPVGCNLGEKLIIGYSCGGRELCLLTNFLFDLFGNLYGAPHVFLVLGHVEKGFIDGDGLNEVGILLEDFVYLHRHLFIMMVLAAHDDEVGTELLGSGHGHGGMHAEPSRLVAGRGHHAARTVEAHGHGLAFKLGVVALLYRREKCIHIHVNYLPHIFNISDQLYVSSKIREF